MRLLVSTGLLLILPRHAARLMAVVSALGGLAGAAAVSAQLLSAPATPASGGVRPPVAASPARPPVSKTSPVPGGAWKSLTTEQQQALRPLMAHWDGLHEAHQRKWLALSKNYARMTPDERIKLQSRMTEWASLSLQQRTEARLNFAEASRLSPEEKKAKWLAYQNLSGEEKKRLAAKAPVKPVGAAPAVKPIPPQKMAIVPQPRPNTQKIPIQNNQVDNRTLLPKSGASAAASGTP